ncbi:MAG: porin [Hyphomicrobium aestuarii]|nr:porin [Hyphomicrobium aestuarii]
MFGGLLKSTSLAALIAVAGFAAAGGANAADLGGNCCTDLEERIAELEATTARKGNRKVSLTISGQVHTGVLFFDDGVESNAYVTDNDNSSSRFRFVGSAKIDSNWSAGYLLEIEVDDAATNRVTAALDEVNNGLVIRQSNWYLDNKQLGRITVGQASTATDDIILADTAGASPAAFADQLVGNSINFRSAAGALTTLSVNTVSAGSFDTARGNVVRYDTPTMAGFRATAAWGEDDFWDVALWYAGKLGDFKIVGGIGYFENNDAFALGVAGANTVLLDSERVTELKGSISIMHEPTGLFGSFAYVDRDIELTTSLKAARRAILANGMEYYYFNGGISVPKLLPVGKTVFYGEYGEGNGVSRIDQFGGVDVVDADLTVYGLGVVQHVPAAEMEIYASYKNIELDARTAAANVNTQAIDIVFTGARIKF